MLPNEEEAVWKALANPIRREFLDLLRERPHTTGELAAKLPQLSRYAAMQHIGVLEEAGLLTSRRQGRVKLHYLNPVPLERIYQRWLHPYAARMAKEMLALEEHLTPRGEDNDDQQRKS
ncbi:MAG: winged helix-turn-helix transcriptional regulator [Anaerolineales bacterium]|nr:winged helix-turn-helix transcriptional regulator [Anaerolineales bacterium]